MGPGRVELGGVSGRPGGWRRRVLASPPPWSPGCQRHGGCREPKGKINKPVFASSPITSTLKANRYWPCHLERSELGPGVLSSWCFQCPVNTVTRCPRPGLGPLLSVPWDTRCRLPLPPCLPQTLGHGHSQGRPQGAGPAPGQSPLRLSCKGNAPPSTGRGERARGALQPTRQPPRLRQVPESAPGKAATRMPVGHTHLLSWVPSRAPPGSQSLVWGAGYGASFTGSGTGPAPRRVGRLALLQGDVGAAAATTAPGDAGEVPPHLQLLRRPLADPGLGER